MTAFSSLLRQTENSEFDCDEDAIMVYRDNLTKAADHIDELAERVSELEALFEPFLRHFLKEE